MTLFISDYPEFHIEEAQEDILGGYSIVIDKFASDRVMQKIDEFNQKSFLNSKKKYKSIKISGYGLELIEFISVDCSNLSGEWQSDSELKIDKLGYVILIGVKTNDFWNGTVHCDKPPLRIKIRNIRGDETVYDIQ